MINTMASSNQRDSVFDPYREIWVAATPEEIVRQKLLHVMTQNLGYPKHLIAVEKQLSEIPHLTNGTPPNRRADILCFQETEGELKPLLLIECKEMRPNKEAKRQVLGYNHFVGAPFVAVAGPGYAALVYPQEIPFLPPYSRLQEIACN